MDDQNPPITVEQILDVHTMSDEEYMEAWAKHNTISAEAVAKLFQEGFTSMEALKLIDRDDLAKAKLPRGQQKLVLASVQRLLETEARAKAASVEVPGDVLGQSETSASAHCSLGQSVPRLGTDESSAPDTHARQATSINIRMSKYGNIG